MTFGRSSLRLKTSVSKLLILSKADAVEQTEEATVTAVAAKPILGSASLSWL
jgi:hypothetical protein